VAAAAAEAGVAARVAVVGETEMRR
jgi:hypothetical protein